MSIETIVENDLDLALHIVRGNIDPPEMYEALEGDAGKATLVLWDMTEADVRGVSPEMLRPFIQRAAELGASRQGGRTAVVAPGDLAYGLARMSEALSELISSPFSFLAFRTRAEALSWLQSPHEEEG